MSIILKALEKRQREKKSQEKPIREFPLYTKPMIKIGRKTSKEKQTVYRKINYKAYSLIALSCIILVGIAFWEWKTSYDNMVFLNEISQEQMMETETILGLSKNAAGNTKKDIQTVDGVISAQGIEDQKLPRLRVTGIVWDAVGPVAVVNGKFLTKGDTILETEIVDIQMNQVKFLYKDKEFSILMRS